MKLVHGIWLPDNDTHFIKHLRPEATFNGKAVYQFIKLYKAVQLCKTRQLALDVGAHVGLWSMHLARRFERVVAFEPLPFVGHCWYRNVPDENATLIHYGLSDEAREIFLTQDESNSGVTKITTDGSGYEVRLKALDEVLRTELPVSFMKIDVEGHEAHVVRGARETLLKYKPVLCVEQKGNQDALPILLELGYNISEVLEGDYLLVHNDS
jgi:FkbM family methyltransferase